MQVELWNVADVQPYENNPRRNHEAVAAVARSIRDFGFRQPIVVDEAGVIIVGDTRYKAAQSLGLEKVPVRVAHGLTSAQAKAYRLADNQTNRLSDWDEDRLVRELAALQHMDFDVNLTGFSSADLARLLEPCSAEQCDPDAIPEPPDKPITQRGDEWRLGEHRLWCGDCAVAADVDRLLDGATAQMVNTDPPYNVHAEPRSKNAIAAGLSSFRTTSRRRVRNQSLSEEKVPPTARKLRAKDRPLTNDFVCADEFQRLLRAWFANIARGLDAGRAFYIWGGYSNCGSFPAALKAAGLYFSQAIIWDKQHAVLTRKDFMGAHEWRFYGWREGAAHKFFGPSNATDLWAIKKVNPQAMVYLTEKPVALAKRALEYSSQPGERVLDLFGGSGSTLIACAQTGRRAYLMELDPLYCDVIVERWQRFTGKKATRRRNAAA